MREYKRSKVGVGNKFLVEIIGKDINIFQDYLLLLLKKFEVLVKMYLFILAQHFIQCLLIKLIIPLLIVIHYLL